MRSPGDGAIGGGDSHRGRPEANQARRRSNESMAEWANLSRIANIGTPRDLRNFESAFWMVMSRLRLRVPDDAFARLATQLKKDGLIDISKARKPAGAKPAAGR